MSPSLLNFLPHAVGQGQSQIIYAEVTTPAPASFTDPLYVVMPDWSIEFPFALAEWPAIHGITLPLPGNAVLLIKDSRGNTRCVWWDGQMTFATQSSQVYYLTTTASDITGHTKISSQPFSPKTTVTFAGLLNGQVLLDYMTDPGRPGGSFLPAGQFEFHVHAVQTAGNQSVQIYAEFWEYDPVSATHVAMIGQSQVSRSLIETEIEYRLFFTTTDSYAFVSAKSRIAIHVHVIVGGTGGGANISCFVGGEADSHILVPVGDDVPSPLPNYTTATKPAANRVPIGTTIFVSDGGAGAVFQGSTGSAWVNLG